MERKNAIQKIRAFNRDYTSIISITNQNILNSGLSLAEGRVLFEIRKWQPCSARKIMKATAIDEGYLSRILKKFVKEKLIVKQQLADDKRKYLLTLTEYGDSKMTGLDTIANQATDDLIKKLSEKDITSLLQSMQNIQTLLSNEN